MKKLNPKQEAFCREYVIDSNGKQAAIRAGYSKKTAEVQASRMLSYVKVQEYIQSMRDKATSKTELTLDYVLGLVIDFAENGEQEGNKVKATDMLMKHLGAYTEKIELSGQVDTVQYYAPKKDKDK